MVKRITTEEYNKVLSDDIMVIDFSAEWCGPCKMMAPVLEEVSKEMETKVNFYNIDVDKEPEPAMKNGIMNIPALLIFKNGKVVDKQIGFVPKENLKEFISRNL